jgi:hypothetical protein
MSTTANNIRRVELAEKSILKALRITAAILFDVHRSSAKPDALAPARTIFLI